jgi:hypothetical protein
MWGLGDWGNNYFLLYAARKTGIQGIQTVVASGWVRGAVSGIGILNLGIALWEIINFKRTVRALQTQSVTATDAPPASDNLSHHERHDERSNDR